MVNKLVRWDNSLSFFFGAGIALLTVSISIETPRQLQSPSKKLESEDVSARIERDNDNDDGDIRTALTALNKSAIDELQRALLNTTPWADLSANFVRYQKKSTY